MRKLFNKDNRLKALVVTLIITTISLFGVSYSAFAKTNSAVNDGTKTTSSTPTDDENVYVMTKANGDSYQRIVSADGTLHYKGYENYTLPVSMKITYTLDGQSVTAKELAGESGHVVIHISYTNNIRSGGVNVPFMVVTGLALDDEHFSNVTVDNGKTMDDGSRNIVMGYSFPGMQSSLGLSSSDLSIPESVTISADTDKYSVDSMYTLVSNEPFKDADFSKVNNLSDLKAQLSKITTGINQLVDGVAKIDSGATKLSAGVKTLDKQLNTKLTSSAKASAAAQAKASVEAQFGSSSDSNSYYNQIKNQASSTFYNTVASSSNISAAQKQVLANLGITNIASQAKTSAETAAKKQIAANGLGDMSPIETAIYNASLEAYYTDNTGVQKYTDAANIEISDAATKIMQSGATQVQSVAQGAAVAQLLQHPSATAIAYANGAKATAMGDLSTKVTTAIVDAAGTAASGTATAVAQQVASGVTENVMKSVASSAKDTVGTSLADSVEQAAIAAAQSATTQSIDSTKSTIAQNIEKQGLVSGASQLAAGTGELKSSVDSMADQVLGKLSQLSKSDLLNVIKNIKSVSNAGKSYNSFGSGSYNAVTFIYKTDEVSPK